MSNDYYLSSIEYMLANLNDLIFNGRAYFEINNRNNEWSIKVNLKEETLEDDAWIPLLIWSGSRAFYDASRDLLAFQENIVECIRYLRAGELLVCRYGYLRLDFGDNDRGFYGWCIIQQSEFALRWLKERNENNGN